MTKFIIIILIVCYSACINAQQIQGVIYYQNSGGKPASNVEVSAFGCDTRYTDSRGKFILPCPNKGIGQGVHILVGSTDGESRSIEVVNEKQLKTIIPRDPTTNTIEIIICYAGQRNRAALRYYNILSKPTLQEYNIRLEAIQTQLERNSFSEQEKQNLNNQIKQLEQERDDALQRLESQSREIANINQDQVSELVKGAILNIEQGKDIINALAIIFGQEESEDITSLQTLESKFASIFNRPSELIELNIPPADGRYPGAILLSPQSGQTLIMSKAYRPQELPKSTSNISITLDGKSRKGIISKLLGNFNSGDDIEIKIDLSEIRMFEAELTTQLKKELLKNRDVYKAEKRGLNPRAIVRAYEAKLNYTIKKRTSSSSQSWNQIKNAALELGGRLMNKEAVSISSSQPSIIAYESVLVNYIVNNLDAGEPDEVKFKEYIVEQKISNQLDLSEFGVYPGDQAVTYLTMGNREYNSEHFGNLDMVEQSTSLVEYTLKAAGASPLINKPTAIVATSKDMENVLESIKQQKKQLRSKSLFIFYYVGHAVAGPNGQMYLVMKDYQGDPKQDIGDDHYFGLSRELLEAPSSPVSGTNFGELMDLANVIGSTYPEEIAGLYPVSIIEQKLSSLNTPFIILVDACYSVEQMTLLRERLSLTPNGDYYGPDFYGGPDQVKRYANAIQDFGKAPYLRSNNVIILSAAPGSIAVAVPNPKEGLLTSKYVGPLSKRIYNRFEHTVLNGKAITYGRFLYPLIDVKKLGEIRIQGSVSWSDFSLIDKIQMFVEHSSRK